MLYYKIVNYTQMTSNLPTSLRSKLLRINSAERLKAAAYGYTSSNFRLDYNLNIPDLVKVHSIVLKSCSIPNTQYNIGLENNSFLFSTGGVLSTIPLLVGNYTIAELITALTTSAQAIAVGMSIVIQSPTGKLEFSFTTNSRLYTSSEGNELGDTLGLTIGSGVDVPQFLAPSLPNLTGLQNVYIVSRTLSGGAGLIDPKLNQLAIFAHVQMISPFGTYNHYISPEERSDEIFFPSDRTLGEVDIALVNDQGVVIDLQGLEWNCIIKIYYHVNSIM